MTTTTYTAQQVVSAYAQEINLGAAAILDSSANVVTELDALEPIAVAGDIGSITFTDSTAPALSLTGTQAANDADVLKLFQGNYTLGVTDATVAQAEQLAAVPHVATQVFDTPSNILAALDQLQSIAGSLSEIDIAPYTGNQPQSTLTLTQAQLTNDAAAVAKLVASPGGGLSTEPVVLTVSGTFSMAQAVVTEEMNGYISGLSVVDSLANLEAALSSLQARPDVELEYEPSASPGTYNFSSITLTDSGTVTVAIAYHNDANDPSPLTIQNAEGFLSAITNQHIVEWTDVPIDGVSALLDSDTFTPSTAGTLVKVEVAITDTAANVSAVIDYLENYDLAGKIASISVTDGNIPTFTAAQLTVDASVIAKITVTDLSAATAIADASDLQAIHGVSVQDSAANVSASLDGLETIAAAGKLVSVTLSDSGIPTIAVTTTQAAADADALSAISGKFTMVETASGSSESIVGVQNAIGNTVVFADTAASYTITPDGNGTGFTVSETGMADHLSDIQALQFSDFTEIVASQTAVAGAAVTSAQITTLYAAVLAREPDVAGLGFYENYAAANPTVGIVTYAEYFLSSSEYTSNSTHTYAQTEAGEAQFITDTYNNLLHRAPETGAVAYYEGVIDPMLANLTPGTTAYTQALLVAHATVLSYFSQSPEFLGDVQVTASNPASAQHWLVLI